MELIIRMRDVYITLAALAAFGALCVHHWFDSKRIEQELKAFAHNEAVMQIGSEQELAEWDEVAVVHSEKSFHLFGPAWGAIHLFLRKKGDAEMKTFKGYEFYLKREDGKWREVDSSGCGALEHHVDGFEVFEKLGLEVAQAAYDKALGFGAEKHVHDHDHDHKHDHDHDDEKEGHTREAPKESKTI